MRRRTVLAFPLALAVGSLVACRDDDDDRSEDTSPGQQGSTDEGTVVIALPSEPESLSPLLMDFYFGNWPIFNGLVRYGADLELEPDLAAELPSVSEDGRAVTVRIRDGVVFHDGQPLTAEDVVFTWQALMDPALPTELRDYFGLRELLSGVRAIDERTVEFALTWPDASFLHKLYLGIVPKHVLEGQDLTGEFNRRPIGTGPYVFREWSSGSRLVLEANGQYFRETPAIARLVFTFVPDENARVAQLQAGTIDAAGLPPRLAETFRGDDRFTVFDVPSADARVAILPFEERRLADPRVRRAFSHAIDREAIVRGVLAGSGAPAFGPYIKDLEAPAVAHDPERARALLREAGWELRDGQWVQNGERLGFTLMYPAADSVRRDIALAIRSDLSKIDVEVEVEGLGWDAILDRFGKAGNVFGWGQPYDPALELPQLFHSRYADDEAPFTNPARIRNAEIDRALDEGSTSVDPRVRRAAYERLLELIQEDGHWLYVVMLKPTVVMRATIEGVKVQTEGHAHGFSRGIFWSLEEWRLRS